MPTRPRTFRPASGPGSDADRKARTQAYDRRRRAETETRALYGTARWQATRREQLRIEPLCRMCLALDVVTAAIVCDHVEPHRGDVVRFWSGPFQSLCVPCHDGAKQAEERAGR
ncbi:HNH endonuclease [Methylobacterium sp. CM6244]